MAKKRSNAEIPAVIQNSDRKDSASFNFKKATGIEDAFGEVDVGDTVSVTVTGKVTRINMNDSKSSFDNYESSNVDIDITSIKGMNKQASDNKKELDDMLSEKE